MIRRTYVQYSQRIPLLSLFIYGIQYKFRDETEPADMVIVLYVHT